jgi:nucleotide-binding universal stress UspA family protein
MATAFGGNDVEAAHPTPAESAAHVLVVANETVGGQKLFDAIARRAARGPIRCTVVCPQNTPKRGFVIYDDTVRSAARVRLDLTLERLREMGIEARGEVMDPDPYMAVQDAIREWGADEIIISTYPYPRSGWLRRDLVERIRSWSGLPVEHVVVDLREEPMRHVLVAASQTVGGRKLIETLERRATSSPHSFTVICPQTGPDDEGAQERLDRTIAELRQAGLNVTGYVTEPDPFRSIMNAFEHYHADEIVISTLPTYKSRWLRGDLIGKVSRATGRPVEHVVSDPAPEERPAEAGVA